MQVDSIIGKQLKAACLNAKHSAAGLDNFSPLDFTLLSDDTYDWLAILLDLVEQGEPWPQALLQTKASYLWKDTALAYRVLLILSCLYRRWATVRLHDLRPWIRQWEAEGMNAGTEATGSQDAWWETALTMEHCRITGTPFSGGASDIYKCFDQLPRHLVYHLAHSAGMPKSSLPTTTARNKCQCATVWLCDWDNHTTETTAYRKVAPFP